MLPYLRLSTLALLLCAACHHDSANGNDDLGVGDAGDFDLAGADLTGADLFGFDLSTGCPTYQNKCGGQCIQTVNDPANCGGCGVTCTGATYCYGGKCVDTCPLTSTGQGLKPCGNACVDVASDNANCGTCGNACMGGKVCSDGACVDGIATTPGAGACTGTGPLINVPTAGGGTCAGSLAATSFTWALCACDSVSINGNLATDAFDSTTAPYAPGGKGGPVGTNGPYTANQSTDVGGTFWTSSTSGLQANQAFTAHQDLYVNGPTGFNQACTVGLDAHINGTLTVTGSMAVTQTLYVPASVTPSVKVTYNKLVQGPVPIGPACECDAAKQVQVAAIVDAAATTNDNATIGLDATVLSNLTTATRLDLPCGSYYVDSIHTNSALTIVAHGHTALYVGGDITSNQNLIITVDPIGSFDLFVKGTITNNQKLSVGSLNAPALMRAYLGSSSTLTLNQGFLLAGNLYSALGNVTENQAASIYGSIFTKAFTSNQNTEIHYDTAVTTQGAGCGGGSMTGCGSCTDCNNQACVMGTCGSCTTDADCCAPLVCDSGTCIAVIL